MPDAPWTQFDGGGGDRGSPDFLSASDSPAEAGPPEVPGTQWPRGVVHYCWEVGPSPEGEPGSEMPAASHPRFALVTTALSEALRETWSRVTRISFEDDGNCRSASPSENRGLATLYFASGPPAAGVGYHADRATRVRFDPTSPNWKRDALDAFARVMGVPHAPGAVAAPSVPEVVRALRREYGRKHSGTLVGPSDRCLDVPYPWPMAGRGAETQIFHCHGLPNQIWRWEASGALRATIDGVPLCLSARSRMPLPSPAGTSLETDYCTGSWNQVFQLIRVSLKGSGGLCVTAGAATAGQTLSLADCRAENEGGKWDVQLDRRLRLSGTELCIADEQTAGQPVRLQSCPTTTPLDLQADGEIARGASCLVPADVTTNAPTPLVWQPCTAPGTAVPESRWFQFSGRVTGPGETCLDLDREFSTDHALALLRPCNVNSQTQIWDLHF